MASKELLLFCTCRAACTMSSRVCAPGKFVKNSWFCIFSALRAPCLRECAHHVFGSVRTLNIFLKSLAFPYHVFASVRTWQISQELLVFHFLRVTYTMASGVCAPGTLFGELVVFLTLRAAFIMSSGARAPCMHLEGIRGCDPRSRNDGWHGFALRPAPFSLPWPPQRKTSSDSACRFANRNYPIVLLGFFRVPCRVRELVMKWCGTTYVL